MNRILFVEDDPFVARIYNQQLVRAGYEVTHVADGLEAMKQVSAMCPDLVVLDILIPKLNGLDVLRFIRQDPKLQATPVVVFSNAFLNDMADQLAALKVQDMLLKAAIRPKELIETIQRVLKASRPKTEAAAAANPDLLAGTDSGREKVSEFGGRIRRDFFEQIPAINKALKQVADGFLNATDPHDRVARLEMLSRKMGFLTHMTSMAGCYRIAQLASAFEALLYELHEHAANITESSLNTVTRTTDLLVQCLSRADHADEQCLSPTSVLVVDDDAVSNRALSLALGRHRITVASLTDPFAALEKLKFQGCDLLLLDINMPGMDGLELCRRLREMPRHANIPVIFFTSHMEFEPRARQILQRGDDLIAKPILPIELTVKIISNFIQRRISIASRTSIEV